MRFLDDDLLPQVKQAFSQYQASDRTAVQTELDEAIAQASTLGVDPDTVPKVVELRAKLEESGVDIAALESEVFSHLYSFFRRYYHEGDFLSLRRYKEGVYAIPYDGEEVKLHWANADQYYIKSSEYLRDYTFKLPSGKRVHFKLVEASTEQDNNKAASGKERRFILCDQEPLVTENGELTIRFDYRPDNEKRKQKELSADAEKIVLESDGFDEWTRALSVAAPTEANPNRTLLAKHLRDYTARNTFDYFIHKDLGGFLRRELDFYIKNEVMHLDDIENQTVPRVEQYLSKIKALRMIAHKIIAFLEQLENFQKKLWLKKKFVIETNYCVTLDRVPEELYEQITKSDAQREEWVKLFAIDEIEADLAGGVVYSEPLTTEFLKANPFLVLDTQFFDDAFRDKMLSSIETLDAQTQGLLIHGDNFHAIFLLCSTYRERVACLYLDPPFNTSEETFVYKNNYKHSSWLSMIDSRANASRTLLAQNGVAIHAIDDEELYNLKSCLDGVYRDTSFLGTVVIQNNPRGRTINEFFATSHEYFLAYSRNIEYARIHSLALTDEQRADFGLSDAESPYRLLPFRRSGGLSTPAERPNSEYAIYYNKESGRIDIEPFDGAAKIMPVDGSGRRRVWRQTRPSLMKAVGRGDIVIRQRGDGYSVSMKDRIKDGRKAKTIWYDSKYDASSHGTILLRHILGDRNLFSFPKSFHTVIDTLRCAIGDASDSTVLDYFAGSGTTGHAVIDLNRDDGGERKYILVEMGEYFESVTKPRIQKVIYSKDWKDGKPVSREGSSHMFKYTRLESYEDALNNLSLKRTDEQQALLDDLPEVREEYMLSYMLDVESRGSASLLDVTAFDDPYAYKMNIARGDETKAVNVDLVETFNYLIGLTVKHIDHIRGVRVINGTSPSGERVLVLWRKVAETDNDALDKWFTKQGYNSQDMEYDLIYVNGDNNLENLRREDHTWKVRLIEEDFHRLMFDVEDV